jgi:hypothetical protein
MHELCPIRFHLSRASVCTPAFTHPIPQHSVTLTLISIDFFCFVLFFLDINRVSRHGCATGLEQSHLDSTDFDVSVIH